MAKPELRIRRLTVTNFRGVSLEKSLLFDSKSVLLFGENGTGKSTFVDALEKVFTGQVHSLDDRGQGVSSQRHGPHINNPGATDVAVVFDDKSEANIETEPKNFAPAVREYLETARTPVYILRRAQVLTLVESPPRERYEFLKPYLVLSEIEQAETSLKAARDKLALELGARKAELSGHLDDLRRHINLRESPVDIAEEQVVAALNLNLSAVGAESITSLGDIPRSLSSLDSQLSKFGDISRVATVKSGIETLEEMQSSLSPEIFGPLNDAVDRLLVLESKQTSVINEHVLEEGAKWIEKEHRNECPLCEQEMLLYPPTEVVLRARRRIEQVRELVTVREAVRRQVNTLTSTMVEWQRRIQRFKEQLVRLDFDGAESAGLELDAVVETLRRYSVSGTSIPGYPESIRAAEGTFQPGSEFLARVSGVSGVLKSQLALLPSATEAQKLLSIREQLNRATAAWDAVSKAMGSFARASGKSTTAEKLVSTFERTRKDVVTEIFNQINADINSLYFELHKHHEGGKPEDASHRNLRLEVRDAVQQSVNLRGDFYSVPGVDPRAYYSDAHLDTLGICIFLALRRWYRKQYPAFNLLVLDDVLSSIDASHAVRLAEVLLTQFSDYQILLTTHDRLWFEHLRDIQARCGVAQNFINKSIYGWDIAEGPDLKEPFDEHTRLKELIATGQRYEMASAAGRLLEHILQEMRYALRLRVAAKPGELYEIGDLWPAFYRESKKSFPNFYHSTQEALDSLDIRWPVRNWLGAHFNGWALNAPKNVVQEFAAAVVSLFESVFCLECRRFIAPSMTPLGQIACRCGHKIYPAAGKKESPVSEREAVVASTAGSLRNAKLTTEIHLEWKKAERTSEN